MACHLKDGASIIGQDLQEKSRSQAVREVDPMLRIGDSSHRKRLADYKRVPHPAKIAMRICEGKEHSEDAIRMKKIEVNNSGRNTQSQCVKIASVRRTPDRPLEISFSLRLGEQAFHDVLSPGIPSSLEPEHFAERRHDDLGGTLPALHQAIQATKHHLSAFGRAEIIDKRLREVMHLFRGPAVSGIKGQGISNRVLTLSIEPITEFSGRAYLGLIENRKEELPHRFKCLITFHVSAPPTAEDRGRVCSEDPGYLT